VTGLADVHEVPEDLRRRQGNWLIGNIRPPKNFLDQIHWVQSSSRYSVSVAGSGAVTESNQSFSLYNNVNDYASYTSVFDQFCIWAAHVAVVCPVVVAAPNSSSANLGRVLTAIDYDNVTNLGSENSLLEFNSVSVSSILPGRSHERVVKPAVDISLYSSSYGVGRVWVDSASYTTPHYGIRVMTVGANTSYTNGLDIIVTLIVGFRNNV